MDAVSAAQTPNRRSKGAETMPGGAADAFADADGLPPLPQSPDALFAGAHGPSSTTRPTSGACPVRPTRQATAAPPTPAAVSRVRLHAAVSADAAASVLRKRLRRTRVSLVFFDIALQRTILSVDVTVPLLAASAASRCMVMPVHPSLAAPLIAFTHRDVADTPSARMPTQGSRHVHAVALVGGSVTTAADVLRSVDGECPKDDVVTTTTGPVSTGAAASSCASAPSCLPQAAHRDALPNGFRIASLEVPPTLRCVVITLEQGASVVFRTNDLITRRRRFPFSGVALESVGVVPPRGAASTARHHSAQHPSADAFPAPLPPSKDHRLSALPSASLGDAAAAMGGGRVVSVRHYALSWMAMAQFHIGIGCKPRLSMRTLPFEHPARIAGGMRDCFWGA